MLETMSLPKTNPPRDNQAADTNTKHGRLIAKTWAVNHQSDYTEKIRELGENYSYSSNSDRYWCDPEISLLYDTPLYKVASEQQKIALNHLYWMNLYQGVNATEVGAIIYNQIGAGLFESIGGCETLCQELMLETAQEKQHVRAFQKICTKTKIALLGKTLLGNYRQKNYCQNRGSGLALDSQYYALRWLAKIMLRRYGNQYSSYLRELEQKGKSIPVPTYGVVGQLGSLLELKSLTIGFGISPFLSCQSFAIRFASNAILKAQEICYSKYFLEFERKGERPPAPTAVSRYHFLDESFHTTISQAIGLSLYRDFPPPNAYEKFQANRMFYNLQRNMLGGLSGVLPGRCVTDDINFMSFFYKVLRSPIFEMSHQDTLHWLEKCFCEEHDGFHVTLKYHQRLLLELQRFFGKLEYLWPVNRELRMMTKGGAIDKALQANGQTFEKFSRLVNNQLEQSIDSV